MASLYNNQYYHRDLSWLRFNHRVLQEASDKLNPLYERIKFLAIFSSNLDEFFKVRVSDIRQIKAIEKPLRKKLITKPNKVLKEIKHQVHLQQQEFGHIFYNEIVPELKEHQIHLINFEEFNSSQQQQALTHFNQLQDKLELESSYFTFDDQVFVENEALYLVGQTQDNQFQLVKIPDSEDRFIVFNSEDDAYHITFIDEILKYGLRGLSQDSIDYFAIKISRDAELYIEDEYSGNLMEKIKESLAQRQTGQPTRVLIDENMPTTFKNRLQEALDVFQADIVLGGRHHNFKDFFGFPNPTKKNFYFEEQPPLAHPLEHISGSIFEAIDKKDQLIHGPYQSFESIIRLVETAANDLDVTTIKMTMYRIAEDSRLNRAIVKAIESGKEVTVFIEIKARFDEKNNLKWGAIFKEKGANVIYSYPGIKVHSKILYIEKRQENTIRSYGYIGTGNFNENTAKVYTDLSLITSHKKITRDLGRIFKMLEGQMIIPKEKKLLVSPFSSRDTFVAMVKNEIRISENGGEGLIILKMNSLEDKDMIDLLYKASNAGVTVRLIIRGICCLVPNIEGQSKNIYVTSILDRYLEHGRIYYFKNGGDEKVFVGSADWMKRNLSYRIEVITPILDPDHFKTIKDLLDILIQDNVKARIIDKDQSNTYVENALEPIRAQYKTYEYFKERL